MRSPSHDHALLPSAEVGLERARPGAPAAAVLVLGGVLTLRRV